MIYKILMMSLTRQTEPATGYYLGDCSNRVLYLYICDHLNENQPSSHLQFAIV